MDHTSGAVARLIREFDADGDGAWDERQLVVLLGPSFQFQFTPLLLGRIPFFSFFNKAPLTSRSSRPFTPTAPWGSSTGPTWTTSESPKSSATPRAPTSTTGKPLP